jgi:hypothetical protein
MIFALEQAEALTFLDKIRVQEGVFAFLFILLFLGVIYLGYKWGAALVDSIILSNKAVANATERTSDAIVNIANSSLVIDKRLAEIICRQHQHSLAMRLAIEAEKLPEGELKNQKLDKATEELLKVY